MDVRPAATTGSAAVVDQVERLVVVGGVVVLPVLLTGDDAPRAAGGGAGGDDRVLVVVAGRPAGQDAFPVLEDGAVLVERVGAAPLDQVERVVGLGRQVAVAGPRRR
jgi:hypothetical protein